MRWIPLVLACALLSCDSPTEPLPRPPGAVPMDPVPEVYREWDAEVAECSGVEDDFDRLRFYVVPDVSAWESTANGKRVHGEVWADRDVYIAEAHMDRVVTVKHELIHTRLPGPNNDHPSPPFRVCDGWDA